MTSDADDPFKLPDTKAGRRRRLRNRLVLALVIVLLIGITGIGIYKYRTSCGGFGSGVEKQDDGQCIGVTDNAAIFGKDYAVVDIAGENKRVNDELNRDPTRRAVTIALLNPMTVGPVPSPARPSAFTRDEVTHLLKGAYTAQHDANHADGLQKPPLIRLVLANDGSDQGYSHADSHQTVMRQLAKMKDDPQAPLRAVVGLGTSTQRTSESIRYLSGDEQPGIPTVGAITTADQLGQVAKGGFVRVAPTNRDYVSKLREYLNNKGLLHSPAILVSDDNAERNGDLFARSIAADFKEMMKDLIEGNILNFHGSAFYEDANRNKFDVDRVCSARVVLFAGRKVDLGHLLNDLKNSQCIEGPITVLTADADASFDKNLANQITVVYADASDPIAWKGNRPGTPPGFDDFLRVFRNNKFSDGDLDDGKAIAYYDAVLTAITAIRKADQQSPSGLPTPADVRRELRNLNNPANPVHGAGGDLYFDQQGNPHTEPSVHELRQNGR